MRVSPYVDRDCAQFFQHIDLTRPVLAIGRPVAQGPYLPRWATLPIPQPTLQPEPMVNKDLRERIREAVKIKLGEPIDDKLLETIITRVLNNIEVK